MNNKNCKQSSNIKSLLNKESSISIANKCRNTVNAFTIVELMGAMMIIAILSVMAIMSGAGRINAPGGTAAVRTVAAALDYARTEAVKSGENVFVAFSNDNALLATDDQSALFGLFTKDDTLTPPYKQLQPWQRIPPNFKFQNSNASNGIPGSDTKALFTVTDKDGDNKDMSFPYVEFNSFGKVENPSTNLEVNILTPKDISENATTPSLATIKIYRLKGRVETLDK